MNDSNELHDELDGLISRIVDGDAGEAEWSRFEAIAGAEPSAWRELARSQRHHAALAAAVSEAVGVACRVGLPGRGPERDGARFERRLRVWGGWAAAAAVGVAWAGVATRNPPIVGGMGGGAGTNAAGVLVNSPEDAIRAYLDQGMASGRVLGEVPSRIVLERTPIEGGQAYEVVFLRQFVERMELPHTVMVVQQDDAGRAVLVPATLPPPRTTDDRSM